MGKSGNEVLARLRLVFPPDVRVVLGWVSGVRVLSAASLQG